MGMPYWYIAAIRACLQNGAMLEVSVCVHLPERWQATGPCIPFHAPFCLYPLTYHSSHTSHSHIPPLTLSHSHIPPSHCHTHIPSLTLSHSHIPPSHSHSHIPLLTHHHTHIPLLTHHHSHTPSHIPLLTPSLISAMLDILDWMFWDVHFIHVITLTPSHPHTFTSSLTRSKSLTDAELEQELGITNTLHRMKLRLALQEVLSITTNTKLHRTVHASIVSINWR